MSFSKSAISFCNSEGEISLNIYLARRRRRNRRKKVLPPLFSPSISQAKTSPSTRHSRATYKLSSTMWSLSSLTCGNREIDSETRINVAVEGGDTLYTLFPIAISLSSCKIVLATLLSIGSFMLSSFIVAGSRLELPPLRGNRIVACYLFTTPHIKAKDGCS